MLTGIKVIDMSRVLAGPLATMMLGDMGAQVLKIERPISGDETRGWGPPFDSSGQSAYYLSVNRNKLSACLDLTLESDRMVLSSLAAEADVVVENFRAGALARAGVGRESLVAGNPGLVWCTIAGFRNDEERPGYDFVVQAESGWMSITGEPHGSPMKHGVALADVMAGKDAAIAILAALVERGRTGRGRVVRVSLQETAEAALVNVAQNALVSGSPPARWGNAHVNLVPYQLFDAADRAIVIAVGSDAQWLACMRALDLHDLASDVALRTNAGRVAARDRIVREMSRKLQRSTAAEWRERLDAAGVPNGLVRSVLEVLEDTASSATTGMPPSIPGTIRRAPPGLGQHTDLVRERGWGAF